MLQIVLVGIGAGTTAALLFASIATGSIFATLLFYLAPLPILIAGLGWSHWAALVASMVAAAVLGAIVGFYLFTGFLIAMALPAWWLSYLSLLARTNETGTIDWYPIGRLVLWAAAIGAVLVISAVLSFGMDKAAFQAALRAALEQAVGLQTGAPSGGPEPINRADVERLIDILVPIVAPAAAAAATLVNVLNLWLAGRIVRTSGRLARPWPDLAALSLPSFAPGLAAGAIAGSFLPDIAGVVSSIAAASLLMAFAMLGFAVLHALTQGFNLRPLMLGGAYGAVVLFVWPLLIISLLGLADAAFDFRRRLINRRGPPTLRT
jgi:Predicted membrane protein (DUF2232)